MQFAKMFFPQGTTFKGSDKQRKSLLEQVARNGYDTMNVVVTVACDDQAAIDREMNNRTVRLNYLKTTPGTQLQVFQHLYCDAAGNLIDCDCIPTSGTRLIECYCDAMVLRMTSIREGKTSYVTDGTQLINGNVSTEIWANDEDEHGINSDATHAGQCGAIADDAARICRRLIALGIDDFDTLPNRAGMRKYGANDGKEQTIRRIYRVAKFGYNQQSPRDLLTLIENGKVKLGAFADKSLTKAIGALEAGSPVDTKKQVVTLLESWKPKPSATTLEDMLEAIETHKLPHDVATLLAKCFDEMTRGRGVAWVAAGCQLGVITPVTGNVGSNAPSAPSVTTPANAF